jgi:subtilisin family serine protease
MDAVPIVSVGALNPNGTDALFSNTGPWVRAYAAGASVVSTVPPFDGGLLPAARTEAYQRVRESLDPDDYAGEFAVWSGTSFSAPLLAGRVAAALLPDLPPPGAAEDSAAAVSRSREVVAALTR